MKTSSVIKEQKLDTSLAFSHNAGSPSERFLKLCRSPVGVVGIMAYIIVVANLGMLMVIEGIFKLLFNQDVSGFEWASLNAVLTAAICIPAMNIIVMRPMLRQQETLKRQFNKLRIAAVTFESPDGFIVTDPSGKIIEVNHSFTKITGYTGEEAAGKTPALLSSGKHGREFYEQMWQGLARDRCWSGEIWNRRKNGKLYPEWLTITAILNEDGNVVNYVGIFSDITQRKAAEAEIYELAFYDPLTHLPNRRLLNDRLIHTFATSRRSKHYGAILFIDLDKFKPLNDLHGHAAGDLLLIEAARRISLCVREIDTVARFGGDEFVVVLDDLNTDEQESIDVANAIALKIQSALSEPYSLTIQKNEKVKPFALEHCCTSSIGVALFADYHGSHGDVLNWADMAMYRAKRSGANNILFYNKEDGISEKQPEVA